MLEWRDANRQYISSAEDAFMGEWCIFRIYWDGTVPKGQKDVYALRCSLPGVRENLGHYGNADGAKAEADRVLAYWLKRAQLESLEKP